MWNHSNQVWTAGMLLHSLWERYEPSYPPSYGLNSITTILLEGWLWHWITYKSWYAIKQRNQTKLTLINSVDFHLYITIHGYLTRYFRNICYTPSTNVYTLFWIYFYKIDMSHSSCPSRQYLPPHKSGRIRFIA